MDDIINRLWKDIEDMEVSKDMIHGRFAAQRAEYERAVRACDERIKQNLSKIKELLSGE